MDNEKIELSIGGKEPPKDFFSIQDKERGERYFVRKDDGYDEVTKPPVKPVRVHKDRNYIMHDSASFVEAVQEYGDDKTGIIFYELAHTGLATNSHAAGHITMFFDHVSREEKISLPLVRSLEFRSFLNGPEKTFDQKAFLKLIDTFPECIVDAHFLRPMVEKVQLSTAIDYESNADPNNITFIYKEKSGDQSGRLPRKLTLSMPFFEGRKNKVEIIADLEVSIPKEEGAKPSFKLVNVKHERTERDALKDEVDTLQSELAGWLFVNGKF